MIIFFGEKFFFAFDARRFISYPGTGVEMDRFCPWLLGKLRTEPRKTRRRLDYLDLCSEWHTLGQRDFLCRRSLGTAVLPQKPYSPYDEMRLFRNSLPSVVNRKLGLSPAKTYNLPLASLGLSGTTELSRGRRAVAGHDGNDILNAPSSDRLERPLMELFLESLLLDSATELEMLAFFFCQSNARGQVSQHHERSMST